VQEVVSERSPLSDVQAEPSLSHTLDSKVGLEDAYQSQESGSLLKKAAGGLAIAGGASIFQEEIEGLRSEIRDVRETGQKTQMFKIMHKFFLFLDRSVVLIREKLGAYTESIPMKAELLPILCGLLPLLLFESNVF
jgi:hypothetical protein